MKDLMLRLAAAAMLAALGPAEPGFAGAVPIEALQSIEVEGTGFKVTMVDGRALRSPELVGAVLRIAAADGDIRLRIDAVEPDPGDASAGIHPSQAVWLHSFSVGSADGSWTNLCEPGPDGRRQGFPLAGRTRADATIAPAEPGAFILTCTGGAQGKCVRFGYHPWERGPAGVPLLFAYNACVRLVRADYAGDGHGTTRNGQPIDIYDALGIQRAADAPGYEFEAGWTPEGAVCVRHVRVKENATLAKVEASAARLAGRVGDICTEALARAAGAILFARSPP
jgi:hypothetical protein